MRGLAFCSFMPEYHEHALAVVFFLVFSVLFLVFHSNIFCVLSFFNAEMSTIIPHKKWHEFQTIFPTLQVIFFTVYKVYAY